MGKAREILDKPATGKDLTRLVAGQGAALAETQGVRLEEQHASLNGLATLGALLRNVDDAVQESIRTAARHLG